MESQLRSPIFDQYRSCESYSDRGNLLTNTHQKLSFSTSFQRGKYLRFEWTGSPFERLENGDIVRHAILLSWGNRNYFVNLTEAKTSEPEEADNVADLLSYDFSLSRASGIVPPLLINSNDLQSNFCFPVDVFEEKSCNDDGAVLQYDTRCTRHRLELSSSRTIKHYFETFIVTVEEKEEMLARHKETDPNTTFNRKFMETTSILISCFNYFDVRLNHPPTKEFESIENALKPRLKLST